MCGGDNKAKKTVITGTITIDKQSSAKGWYYYSQRMVQCEKKCDIKIVYTGSAMIESLDIIVTTITSWMVNDDNRTILGMSILIADSNNVLKAFVHCNKEYGMKYIALYYNTN